MSSVRPRLGTPLLLACLGLVGCDAVSKLRAGKDAGTTAASADPVPTVVPPATNAGEPVRGLDLSGLASARPGAPGASPPAAPGTAAKVDVPARGSAPPAPVPSPSPSPPAASGEGMVPGRYPCSALIGGILSTTGEFRVVSASTYQVSGSGVERYAFDPGSGRVTWLSGLYADGSKFRDATYNPAKRMLRMRAGKDGFSQWTCRLDGKIL